MKKITTDYVKGTKNYKQISDDATPTVPEFVAKWFEENKGKLDYNIWKYIRDWECHPKESAFHNFMNDYRQEALETLILMQYGYYVEKEVEQLYVVEIPQGVEYFANFLKVVDGQVTISCRSGYPDQPEYHLTEAEIRSVWDGYMELAEEVE